MGDLWEDDANALLWVARAARWGRSGAPGDVPPEGTYRYVMTRGAVCLAVVAGLRPDSPAESEVRAAVIDLDVVAGAALRGEDPHGLADLCVDGAAASPVLEALDALGPVTTTYPFTTRGLMLTWCGLNREVALSGAYGVEGEYVALSVTPEDVCERLLLGWERDMPPYDVLEGVARAAAQDLRDQLPQLRTVKGIVSDTVDEFLDATRKEASHGRRR